MTPGDVLHYLFGPFCPLVTSVQFIRDGGEYNKISHIYFNVTENRKDPMPRQVARCIDWQLIEQGVYPRTLLESIYKETVKEFA